MTDHGRPGWAHDRPSRPTGCCRRGTPSARRSGRGADRRAPAPARHLRAARAHGLRGQPRDPGARPLRRRAARPVGRGRGRPGHRVDRRPRLLHAQGRPRPAPVRLVPRRPGRGRRSSRRPGSRSWPTGGWTCSSRRGRSSSTSSRCSRRASATSRSGSSSSRRGSPRRACSTRRASGRCPPGPRTVAVVTSPTGAVWRDVCNVLARRWPLARVVLVACQVQGEGAPASIVGALPPRSSAGSSEERAAGRADDAPAVTILARGGGSLEDLWSFNDERVVRAVVAHPVPGRLRRGPRGGRHAGRLRRRRPGPDAVGRRRAGRAGPARGGSAVRQLAPARRVGDGATGWAVRGGPGRGAAGAGAPRAAGAARRLARAGRAAAGPGGAGRRRAARRAARAQERAAARLAPLLPGRLAADRCGWTGSRARLRAPLEARLARASAGLAATTASLAALGPGRRWSAATRSSGAATTARSCGIRRTHPPGTRCGSRWRAARWPRPATARRATRDRDARLGWSSSSWWRLVIAVGIARGYDRCRPHRPDHGAPDPARGPRPAGEPDGRRPTRGAHE